MTNRSRLPVIVLMAVAVAGLAACGTASSSTASAPAASPKASAKATSAVGTVSALAACKSLAAWENGSSSESVAGDAGLRQTFADTTQPLSGDFAAWTSGIKSGGAGDTANADRLGSDCAAWNVTIFPPDTPQPAPATTAPPVTAGKTVATFSGSGIENTPKFTVTDTWKLDYSFDCSGFGGSGNFIVNEDGGSDFSGASVNGLGLGKSGSTFAYGDAGTHYLQVNSECSWSVKVIDEG
jgi:hypothetical protein